MDLQNWTRIRLTFFGALHSYLGGIIIRFSVMETDWTIWSIPGFVLGVLLLAGGLRYLKAAQDLGEARPPQANGSLAPENRNDPELAIERHLLHHDLPRIWGPLENVGDVIHHPPVGMNDRSRVDIRLATAEECGPVLARVVPQALNLRGEAGVEQAEGIDAHQKQEAVVECDAADRVDTHVAPAEKDDLESTIEGLVLDCALDTRGGAGAKQEGSNEIVQAQIANSNIRVGIHLRSNEIRDSSLVVEGLFLRQDTSLINASALDLREGDIDPCLKGEHEQTPPMEEQTPPMEEQTPPMKEETPPMKEETLRLEEQTVQLDERTVRLDERTLRLAEQTRWLVEQTRGLVEQIRWLKEQTLSLEEQTLSLDEQTLSLEEQTLPMEEKTLPMLGKQTPQLEEQTPRLEEQTPRLEEQSRHLEEKTRCLEEQTPWMEEQAPPKEERSE